MFWKLVVCLLAIGVMGCSLLAMRQARLQAAHELAQTQLRIRGCDERLFKLRTQIGAMVRPEDVRSLVSGMATLKPLMPLPTSRPASQERSAAPSDADPTLERTDDQPRPPAADPNGKPAPGRPPSVPPRGLSHPATDEARRDEGSVGEPLYAFDQLGEDDQ